MTEYILYAILILLIIAVGLMIYGIGAQGTKKELSDIKDAVETGVKKIKGEI